MFPLFVLACFAPDGQLTPRSDGSPPGGVAAPSPRSSDLSPWESSAAHGPSDGALLYAEDAVHDLHIRLSADEIDALRAQPTREVEADLEWEGDWMEVALRLKGVSSFQTIDQKPSFKIDVHEWIVDQRIDGEKRLTLNNMIEDQTMLRERSYYWLSRRLGVPAPRQAYARVWVNDVSYGLYNLVETMDEELVERVFDGDEDGNLYESSGADFDYSFNWFDLEESGDLVAAPDDILDLVDTVEATGDSEFWAMLNANFDMDATLGYWAIDTVAGNDDGYVFNHHNFLVYHAPLAENWSFLPWGTDRSFSHEELPPMGNATFPMRGTLVIRCWADAECADALGDRIADVITVLETELPAQVEEAADRIGEDCRADTRTFFACNPDNLREFIEERPDFMRGWL